MKKTFLIFMVAALMLFAACSAKENRPASPTEPAYTDAPAVADQTEGPEATQADDPAAEPTEDLSAWYVDNAYPLAERIGLMNALEFDKDGAECTLYDSGAGASVSFPARDGSGALVIGARRNAEGQFEIDRSGPYFNFEQDEKQVEEVTAWDKQFRDEQITVTPEDVINAGCTETSGDEYMKTVYRCFAEKLAEKYRALDDEAPGACRSAEVVSVEDGDNDQVLVKMAVSPKNFAEFIIHVDMAYNFFFDETSDFYGLTMIAGEPVLTRQADGSWVGRSELSTGA